MTRATVVVLNYNGEKLLGQFLPSVVANSGDTKIVVADNGSTDNSVSFLAREFSSVGIIKLDRNYGFCGGYNRALKEVKSKYIVLLNSDVEVSPGWLEPMVSLLESDNSIAAVQPKILSYNNRDHFEYAGAGGGFIDSWGYPFCRGRLFNTVEKDEGQYNDTREVFWASGACMVIRSDVYVEQGGLDEDFFAHMEEIDLCWRIKRAGKKIYYCGSSQVFHLGAGTLETINPRKTYYNFRNGLAMIYKHWSTSDLFWRFPVRLMLDYAAMIFFLFQLKGGHALSVIRAHIAFVMKMRRNQRKRAALTSNPNSVTGIVQGSIVWNHYIQGKTRISIP